MSKTVQSGFSDSLFATTHPADPAPTIMKSYSFSSLNLLGNSFSKMSPPRSRKVLYALSTDKLSISLHRRIKATAKIVNFILIFCGEFCNTQEVKYGRTQQVFLIDWVENFNFFLFSADRTRCSCREFECIFFRSVQFLIHRTAAYRHKLIFIFLIKSMI